LSFTLTEEFGGESYEVCLTGGYTFTPADSVSDPA